MTATTHPGWHTTCTARRIRAAANARILRDLEHRPRPDPSVLDRLTPRETVAVRCLAAGMAPVEAAILMGIALNTYRHLISSAYRAAGIGGIGGSHPSKVAALAYLIGLRDGAEGRDG